VKRKNSNGKKMEMELGGDGVGGAWAKEYRTVSRNFWEGGEGEEVK